MAVCAQCRTPIKLRDRVLRLGLCKDCWDRETAVLEHVDRILDGLATGVRSPTPELAEELQEAERRLGPDGVPDRWKQKAFRKCVDRLLGDDESLSEEEEERLREIFDLLNIEMEDGVFDAILVGQLNDDRLPEELSETAVPLRSDEFAFLEMGAGFIGEVTRHTDEEPVDVAWEEEGVLTITSHRVVFTGAGGFTREVPILNVRKVESDWLVSSDLDRLWIFVTKRRKPLAFDVESAVVVEPLVLCLKRLWKTSARRNGSRGTRRRERVGEHRLDFEDDKALSGPPEAFEFAPPDERHKGEQLVRSRHWQRMVAAEKALILLLTSPEPIPSDVLRNRVGYQNTTNWRDLIVAKLERGGCVGLDVDENVGLFPEGLTEARRLLEQYESEENDEPSRADMKEASDTADEPALMQWHSLEESDHWEVMPASHKALIILNANPGPILSEMLRERVGYKNGPLWRYQVLARLRQQNRIRVDKRGNVSLLPQGQAEARRIIHLYEITHRPRKP